MWHLLNKVLDEGGCSGRAFETAVNKKGSHYKIRTVQCLETKLYKQQLPGGKLIRQQICLR
jgi:hypothetical protein